MRRLYRDPGYGTGVGGTSFFTVMSKPLVGRTALRLTPESERDK